MAKYIYHYSTKLYEELKSRAKFDNISEKELEKMYKVEVVQYCSPDVYDKSISFFMDPIPLKTIAKIFDHKHDFWQSGKELYMYVVLLDSLPEDISYYITESPLANEMLANSYKEMPNDDEGPEWDKWIAKFKCRRLRLLKEAGLVGIGLDKLIEQVNKFEGLTEENFRKAKSYIYMTDEDRYHKYAASVPHLMLYPDSGVINYQSVKKVKIA